MAKKNQPPQVPTISELPIPASENPMVIDLPDGQKIVLNKLAPGSVIEVATWRGTGRPDSRTNRFMLGVSDSNAPQPSTEDLDAEKEVRKFRIPFRMGGAKKVENEIQNARSASGIFGKVVNSFSKALNRTRELTPVETTTDLEINAWLENLSREVEQESQGVERLSPAGEKRTTVKKASPKKSAPKKSVGTRSTAKRSATPPQNKRQK